MQQYWCAYKCKKLISVSFCVGAKSRIYFLMAKVSLFVRIFPNFGLTFGREDRSRRAVQRYKRHFFKVCTLDWVIFTLENRAKIGYFRNYRLITFEPMGRFSRKNQLPPRKTFFLSYFQKLLKSVQFPRRRCKKNREKVGSPGVKVREWVPSSNWIFAIGVGKGKFCRRQINMTTRKMITTSLLFRFVSFRFVSFRFVSFRFVSYRIVLSLCFNFYSPPCNVLKQGAKTSAKKSRFDSFMTAKDSKMVSNHKPLLLSAFSTHFWTFALCTLVPITHFFEF